MTQYQKKTLKLFYRKTLFFIAQKGKINYLICIFYQVSQHLAVHIMYVCMYIYRKRKRWKIKELKSSLIKVIWHLAHNKMHGDVERTKHPKSHRNQRGAEILLRSSRCSDTSHNWMHGAKTPRQLEKPISYICMFSYACVYEPLILYAFIVLPMHPRYDLILIGD